MGVNYQIGADASSFKQGVSEAQASLKTLDAALKNNEASFKAGGNAQIFMEQKTQLLNDKMAKQKQLVTQLQQGLKQMREAGVAPTSVEYQKLETQMLNAQTAMNETKISIDNLDESQQSAADSAGALTDAVNGIGKKISLEQVISGIGSITGAMETAASKAVQLGETIWENVMNAAMWADDSATAALMYGVDLDTYLRVQRLVTNGMDTSVEAILKSKQKLQKNIGSGSDSFMQTMKDLGLAFESVGKFGETSTTLATNDPTEMFWKAGAAIMALSDTFEQEEKAQAIFGKSWRELIPLFTDYQSQEAFQNALDGVTVNTEEEVNDLEKLNDTVAKLQGDIQTLTNKGWAALAPSLTAAAEALSGLMGSVLEYLDTPQGKEAVQQMSDSISTLFEDLGKIDPESVVENFVSVFNRLKEGFLWISEHKDDVINALKAIVVGWAGLKLTGGALQVYQLVSGLRSMAGLSGGGFLANAVSGFATWGTNALSTLTGMVGGALNGAVIGDWFLNNTYTGQVTRNTGNLIEGVKAGVEQGIKDVQTNASNFFGDWKGVFNQIFGGGGSEKSFGSGVKVEWEEGGAPEDTILYRRGQGEPLNIPVKAEVLEGTDVDLAAQIGVVDVPARLVLSGAGYGGSTGGGSFDLLRDIGNGFRGMFGFHANGIWSVPFDNYPALLHAGERVVPAREANRSYNSNLYVEKMIMNNGADAQGLANAMAAAQRRRMSGYGS